MLKNLLCKIKSLDIWYVHYEPTALLQVVSQPTKRVYPITLHVHKLVQIERANISAKQISNSLYNAT